MISKNYANKLKTTTKHNLNMEFKDACFYGDLDVVKYLLTSSELKEHASIHITNDGGLKYACRNGHLEIVKYLLTSPDLEEHADIHALDDLAFISACKNGHLEIVKYLLTSPDLKEKANIHAKNEQGFKIACKNNHFDIIQFFIFDLGIEKNKTINSIFHNNKKTSIMKINNMFNLRELNGNLNEELKSNNSNNRKIKL